MLTDNHSTAPGLPRLCYARQPETGTTVLIVCGEAGYHLVTTPLTPEQLNTALAVPPTRQQVQAMLVGSLFGWQVPGADPARHAAASSQAGDAATEPLPLFPVVANPGGPDTPFRLMWRSRIHPGPLPDQDPLWTCAGHHLGHYGWLRVADQHIRRTFGCGILDLPPRHWQGMYEGCVPPTAAADVAIDEHAARRRTGPAAAPVPASPVP